MKVDTWLPVFSGFYGTIWNGDSDAEVELANINDVRAGKGLAPIGDDLEVEWDYDGYEADVCRSVTSWIGNKLKQDGFITAYKFQKLNSPREYNFANDSINVSFTLSAANIKRIASYLAENGMAFSKYVRSRYTSCDGFISSYSNNPFTWTEDLSATLKDAHRLGAVLNFILLNEDPYLESEMYEDVNCNGVTLTAKNFDALVAA